MYNDHTQVVITGANTNTSVGDDLETFYDAIYNGKSNFIIAESPLKTSPFIKYVGKYQKCDLSILPDKKIKKAIARRDIYGIICALKAANHAGIKKGDVNPDKFGIYVGAACVHIQDLEPYFELIKNSFSTPHGNYDSALFGQKLMETVNPMVMLQTLMNNTLCYTSIFLDARGPNGNYMDIQAAGINAIKEGFYAICENRADIALCGGVSNLPEFFYTDQKISDGYLAITASYPDNPHNIIKPYDTHRCGTILSEGSAFVVIENINHAKKRNAKILAQIISCASTADPIFGSEYNMSTSSLEYAILECLRKANITIEDIGLIIGNGSGAIHFDAQEFKAYQNIFNGHNLQIPLVSIKSIIGETSEASGVCSVVCALKIFETGIIPPTFNFQSHSFGKSNIIINNKEQLLTKDYILVVSQSILGVSSCLIVKKYYT